MNRSRVTGDLASHGNIFVDIANDRVGIGSTIPGQKLSLPDSAKIALGNSADLEIYHDGSHSYIHDGGTGNLKLRSNNFRLSNADESKLSATFQASGAAELYHDNAKKLETTSSGVTVTGAVTADSLGVQDNESIRAGNSSDIQFFHDANGSIHGTSAVSYIKCQGVHDNILDIFTASATGKINLKSNNLTETMLSASGNGAVELYHNNTKRIETTTYGVNVTGTTDTDGLVVSGITTFSNATTIVNGGYHRGIINSGAQAKIIGGYISGSDTLRLGESMYLTTTGLGINESNPGHRLTIGGDGYFGFTTPNDAARQIIFNANRGSAGQTLANINWQWNSKNVAQIRGIAGSDTTNKDDGHLAFFTSAANSLVERLRITSDGNVIIGTTSWQYEKPLNVQGESGSIISLYNGDTTSYAANTFVAIELKLNTGNTGNTFGALEIRGIKEEGTNGNNARALTFYTGTNGGGNTERLRIKADGTITTGGTSGFTNTDIRLQVHNPSGTASQMQFTGTGTGATTTSRGFRVGYNGSGGQLWNFENQYIRFATNNIERLRITSDGQLTMTNATTQTFFDFSTTNNSTRGLFSIAGKDGSGNAVTVKIGGFGDTSRGEIYTQSNHGLGFATNNAASQMVLGTNGCLSIGKVGSQGKGLEVYQSADAAIRIQNSTTGTGANDGLLLEAGASQALIWNYESTPMKFGTAGSERLQIRANGSMIAQTNNLSTTPLMELYNSDGDASTGTVLKLRTGRGQSTKDMPIFHITDGTDSSVFEVENSGRVGIFNASPAHLLDIKNETSDEGIRLRSTGNTYHTFYFDAARTSANSHIGRFIAKWNGNNTSMIAMNTGSDTTNKDNGHIAFCASEAGSSLVERFRCQGSVAGLQMQNDCYIDIPHDERCIVFDEGQKMITSNDGQGNFNIIGGKNNNAQHVSSSSGNSGIAQIEINSDGTNGSINFAVGPTRSAGSTANFEKGFQIVYHSNTSVDRLNGLKYTTGSSTSPGGLASSYNVIHRGNAADGTWARVAGDGFKVLGDGGSIAITTNDGHGNCNVCWNHKDGVSDTAGSSWRIRADIDSANSHWLVQNAKSVSNGQTNISVTTRFEIDENGNGYINGNSFSSDQRLKKNIKNITGATDKIKSLTGRTFEWKEELEFGEGTKYGFVAQELETVLPELVSKALVHFDKDGNIIQDNYHNKDEIVDTAKTINTVGVIPVLVEALKDALSEIDSLKARVSTLEGS